MVRLTTIVLSGGLLVACGSDEDGFVPWWEVSTGEDFGGGGDDEDDGFDDDDFDDEDEDLEDGTGFWGELTLQGQVPGSGEAAFYVIQGGEEQCEVVFSVTSSGPAEGCDSCDFTATVTLAGGTSAVGPNEQACVDAGLTAWSGATFGVGHAPPETLWTNAAGSWSSGGFSEPEAEAWFFELEASELGPAPQ